MQRLLIFMFLIVFAQNTNAQDKKIEIKLDERKEGLLDLCHIQGEGFLLKTGKNIINSKKVNWKLRRYSEDLDLLWEMPIEKDQIVKGLPDYLVASRYSNYIYHWEGQGYNAGTGTSKWFITQIDENQNKKTFEKENPNDYINALFVNKGGLLLFTNNGKGYEKVEYKLLSYDHKNMKQTSKVLKLPKQQKPKKGEKDLTNWHFIGQSETHFFLARKAVLFGSKKKEKKFRFHVEIAQVNFNGEVEEIYELDSHLAEWKYVYPHMTFGARNGDVTNHKEIWVSTNINDPNQMLSQEARFNEYASGRIVFDELANQFIVFGHYGDEDEKKKDDLMGVFAQRYDLTGKKLSEKYTNLNQLSEGKDKGMETGFSPASKGLSYTNISGKGHLFELFTRKYAYAVALDENFDLVSKEYVKAKGIAWGNRLGVSSKFGKKGADFIQNAYEGKGMNNGDYRVVTDKGDILFLFDEKNNRLNLLYFKG